MTYTVSGGALNSTHPALSTLSLRKKIGLLSLL